MRLSLDALLVLDAIERKGSFAAAAEELHRVPSAITYTVQKLEQDLDIQIFDRSGHRARLTEVGAHLLKDGRYLLDAAAQLEDRVRQQATGWEPELRIAVSDLVPFSALLPLLAEFSQLTCATRLRLQREVLGGTWDALHEGRADLAIGASDQPPPGRYQRQPLGTVPFVFAVAPLHPLADHAEPIPLHVIRKHRVVAVGDTSRQLPARSSSLLEGQDVLTVGTLADKLQAQLAGLGTGNLPLSLAQPYVDNGQLVVKQVEDAKEPIALFYAWKEPQPGKALDWFIRRLKQAADAATLTY
ncbi:LysR family transcriptional regulator [Pseudogulbenkiania sp. MAI-1]|uniref:LysR family transcriptional regulator n=1 Tax=Pseudogulbenkiania sp. MAI-1 TaxID=990370 RepID=UPI00045EAD7D|nr:LysR family transcriptional regulator [Pseudogulbenkiania sp. MAI-1]